MKRLKGTPKGRPRQVEGKCETTPGCERHAVDIWKGKKVCAECMNGPYYPTPVPTFKSSAGQFLDNF